MSNKKSEKKYNHYVPQFYLKNFSGNNSIGVYNFHRGKFIDMAPIRNTAGKDYLYGKDSDLENWFQELETQWAIIIRNILSTEKVPKNSEEYILLLKFVYLSDVRNVETADLFRTTKLEEGKSMARILSDSGKIKLTDESINNLDVVIERPNLPFIQIVDEMIPVISDLCPLIIINESKIGFITSDAPVAKYNKLYIERGYNMPYGFGSVGFQCFLPLSPRICFCLYDHNVYKNKFGKKDKIRIYCENTIQEFNRLFMQNAYKEIYYEEKNRKMLDNLVINRKMVTLNGDGWIKGNPKNGYIHKMSERCIYEKINLPMFAIYPHFMSAVFPHNSRYLLRKSIN